VLLAHEAGVSASTASSHLSKLAEAGLISVEREGRNRYYRLRRRYQPRAGGPRPDRTAAAGHLTAGEQLRQRLASSTHLFDHLAGQLGRGPDGGSLGEGLLADTTAPSPRRSAA